MEHYEITRYGTLIAWAQELGHQNVVSLLNANLKEEKAADKKLTSLEEGGVNRKASGRVTRAPSRGRSSAAKGITKPTAAIPSSAAKRKSAKRCRLRANKPTFSIRC